MSAGHAKYVYVQVEGAAARWECAACGTHGKFVRSAVYAEELGQKHADKFKGPKGLRDLLKLD
jgi:hypothetical protein